LESKRTVFPRFYFIADDDLLEILGQSKEPEKIQKHLKKMFEGIKELKFIASTTKQSKTMRITTMYSPEGEDVQFCTDIIVGGDNNPVEHWFSKIEDTMQKTLQKKITACYTAYKTKKIK
jgi:dynein heavy chain